MRDIHAPTGEINDGKFSSSETDNITDDDYREVLEYNKNFENCHKEIDKGHSGARCEFILAIRGQKDCGHDGLDFDAAAERLRNNPDGCRVFALVAPFMAAQDWLETEIGLTLFGFSGVFADPEHLERTLGQAEASEVLWTAARLCARHGKALRLASRRAGRATTVV